MTRPKIMLLAASLAAVGGGTAVAAVQSAGAATAHPASASVLKVASVKVAVGSTDKAHSLLVSSKGLPVYLLTGDTSATPKCKGACLTYWPPVTSSSSKPSVGSGVKGKVGVWHHNGINQVTLNGHPMYTYVQDHAGSASGEGLKSFGGTWLVMTPAGTTMAKVSNGSPSGGGSGW